ncbi:signal transduction histidine kinase [Chitinophaga skermanii]|uniref:histidine kinase n=1 Tax=Chitinophaga skermanii TaxID=331697 RepID=A0A327QXQ6_9BACT|nr:hybrid sensor histidine kinase/response regulator transcription factor [Chitinophaga skermanii]RAJ08514.1 signal transduction histidine kinase [Chitinophaga skermanii]
MNKRFKFLCAALCWVGLMCWEAGFSQAKEFQFSRLDARQGLSSSAVSAIYKDDKGFLWFGTQAGLNRFDGYTTKVFRHQLNDSATLNDDYISRIYEGPNGYLWLLTRNGFNIYHPAKENFDRHPELTLRNMHLPVNNLQAIIKLKSGFGFVYSKEGLFIYNEQQHNITAQRTPLPNTQLCDVAQALNGDIWCIYDNGVMEKISPDLQKVLHRAEPLPNVIEGTTGFNIFVDNDHELWAYAPGTNGGIWFYQPTTKQFQHYTRESGIIRLNNNILYGMVQDDNGLIWLGTDHGGINIINKKTRSVTYITNQEDDDKSLSQNSITSLYKDQAGIVWVGTYKRGINYYSENVSKFPLYRHRPNVANSLSYNDVNRFVEDTKGNLWIGTNGGGLIYFNRANGTFTQYRHNPANRNSLSNDVIVSMYLDRHDKLWIGTYYGGLDYFDGKNFKHYKHKENDPTSLTDDRVWEIFEDSEQQLWIGTLAGGLNKFDREKQIFTHHKMGPNSIQSNYIAELAEDASKNLWIGTSTGIDVLEKKSGKFVHYGRRQQLSNENIIAIYFDRHHRMWVGTRDGLNLWHPNTQQFQVFREKDGLPANMILDILEDDDSKLWISTPNGLSKINIETTTDGNIRLQCTNYNENDGLQGREFNENAALKTRKGELVFGGANGFNIFNPQLIKASAKRPPIVFTELQVFNQNIQPGDTLGKRVVLPAAMPGTRSITLRYDENVFAISFAALSFANPEKTRYQYKLEGFSNDWLQVDNAARKANFTNLDPGTYTLHTRAASGDGEWYEAANPLQIIITPPFWKTGWAYALYTLLILGALFIARKMIIQRTRSRFAIEQERREAQRTHELDMMKIKFFTNVSHEFRTPLSLIIAPLEKIIAQTHELSQQKQLLLIHRNAKRLLNLVNQLLDFRKMEVQELKVQVAPGDVAKFVKDVCYSFNDIADHKNIRFTYESSIASLPTSFDHDKIERICFNLLSNAFKFTLPNGEIKVSVTAHQQVGFTQLVIAVSDTGIGIPKEKQDKIFERFFQHDVPGTVINQGSGIGLAITKEFVKLCEGTIRVESEPGKGSTFTVTVPFKITDTATVKETLQVEAVHQGETSLPTKPTINTKKQTILLVEDHEDFRFYLKDNLKQYYNIIEAQNGKEGWQKTLAHHPQLVVSDVSMPVMDGLALCKKIKSDPRTRSIPVILLTALTEEVQQLKGLETGASDYMTKPFNFEIMLSRVRNLIAQQATLKKTFSRQVEAKSSDIDIISSDDKFIQQALSIVEKYLSNPDFSVEELSKELFMSRVAVYKKIYALTGKPPIEFIRSIRLQRAALLLEKSKNTIAEVAYEVGFNNPKYFSKYFKAEFGMLPKDYVAAKREAAKAFTGEDLQEEE